MKTDQKIGAFASITFLHGPLAGKTFHITQPVTTIGRHISNDIVVLDPKISRHHARLVRNEETWIIENCSQNNTVTVNGESVQQATIQHDSTIGLGTDSAFLFHLADDDEQAATAKRVASVLPSLTKMDTVSFPAQTAHPTTNEPRPPTEMASFSTLGISTLEVTNNTTGLKKAYPLAQETINIGRADSNDIVIADSLIADLHLQIVHEHDHWVLIYPHPDGQLPLNGLLYQGRKVRGNRPFRKWLVRGDVFRVTDEHGNLLTLTYKDNSGSSQAALPLSEPVQLRGALVTIGRLPDNDVVLHHPQISAHHARLAPEAETYRLTDLNSTNHTYVNGLRVSNVLLKPDDDIRIGPFRLTYTGDELRQYDESESIRIDAVGLKKVGGNNVVLLDNISLSIPPRSFVALVGSSGAGKSTLLDALSGLRPAQEGTVYFNGQDYYRHLSTYRSQLGYVPQEDIIHRDLTVERALYYAAKLRLPTDFTRAQIEQRIDEVLADVEMSHRRDMLIKKLSGGQRKRISIALELLAKPGIFFLDEPTSGLDPGLDRKIMILLRKLADKGHTVILVTHATSNINVCDAVCFLAQGGHLAYFGPPEEARDYFEQSDFAEIYNSLEPNEEHPAIPRQAEEQFMQSLAYQTYIAKPLQHMPLYAEQNYSNTHSRARVAKRGNSWQQFIILCQRYLELLWNDKWNLSILFLQAPLIGFILCILVIALGEATIFKAPISLFSQGDAQRYLFVMSFAAIMFGSINAAREIIKEIHIYRRERAVNLGILPYLFSKIIILGMLCLVQCALLLGIMSLTAHFYSGILMPAIGEMYITLALTAIAGVLVGLTISALVRNTDQAISFIPLLLLPQVIFSGSMFPLKVIPLQIFGALFSMRWSMAALGSTLDLPGNGDKVFGTCTACSAYQHNSHYLMFTWGALTVTILALGIVTSYLLKRKDVVM